MRHTLTLEADVDAAVAEVCRSSGKPYKEVINTLLRQGLMVREAGRQAPKFRVEPVPMGLRPGISLVSISDLEARLEEESFR